MDMEKDPVMNCPHCEKEMQKIIISKENITITIDRCDLCHGYWFDRTELEKLIKIEDDEQMFTLDPCDHHEANFHCPRCKGILETKILFDIRVDLCVECGGIWLDQGELADIQGRYWTLKNDSLLLTIIGDFIENLPVNEPIY